ncbi:hypothetical protein [Gemmatimonas sp.]|nr:hypothetical protein [Gemmatimonas sp.]
MNEQFVEVQPNGCTSLHFRRRLSELCLVRYQLNMSKHADVGGGPSMIV